MFTRTFNPRQMLRRIQGTGPFAEYCASRGLHFAPMPDSATEPERCVRWQAALARLPDTEQARVEVELSKVNELAHGDALSRLLAAASGHKLPPDTVPVGAPLALWFLLHETALFHEAFLRQEISQAGSWRAAYVPAGIAVPDLAGRAEALADSLREFFRLTEGTGRFCVVDAHPLASSWCFAAYVSDRLRLLDVFTEQGRRATQATRPALPVLFVYHPEDGRVLVKSRLRATDRVLDLFRRFGQAVLGVTIDGRSLAPFFRLDVFKRRFDPPPDAEDMEQVRVKALHLVYPEREGRRRVKLETLSGDDPSAIVELLRRHGGGQDTLDRLGVLYVELQVKLRTDGRLKSHLIRIWPDRCNLNQTPLGQRLHDCLKRWGIPYAR